MLLPDDENLSPCVRAELEALHDALGPNPDPVALKAARQRLSPRVRRYLRELGVRALVTEEALRMLASGELPDVRFSDDLGGCLPPPPDARRIGAPDIPLATLAGRAIKSAFARCAKRFQHAQNGRWAGDARSAGFPRLGIVSYGVNPNVRDGPALLHKNVASCTIAALTGRDYVQSRS
jgi:hypothetical protein